MTSLPAVWWSPRHGVLLTARDVDGPYNAFHPVTGDVGLYHDRPDDAQLLARAARGLCMAPSPQLSLGTYQFEGGACSLPAWHRGAHRNDDGTSWTRGWRLALYRARGWAVLAAVLFIAMAHRVVTELRGRR